MLVVVIMAVIKVMVVLVVVVVVPLSRRSVTVGTLARRHAAILNQPERSRRIHLLNRGAM